ncbi:MAG: hypothetical protein CML95_00545 [Rhodobiaceae bacterium]|nr:hypothetical protein [Rhodobiaceae bacterium]|tara:strand:- start:3920 stop:5209 length:1290 start_codon:yes stop_codon:yes gene_type:complete
MLRLPFLIIIFSLLSLTWGPLGLSLVHAQEVQKEKPKKPKTRRSQVLGKSAFRLIERSQELLAEEKYDEAMAVLKTILDGQKFNSYEKAVAIQTSGYIHAGKEDYEATIAAFERAIATGDLPPRVVSDLTYGLAQLHLAKERPRKSLELMDKWFAAQEKEPGGEPFALKAQIHLILDELRSAEQAIKKALSKEEEPKQQWTRILLSVLLQEERYSEALPILENSVQIWPGVKAFWEQLVAIYYHFEKEDMAFVARRAMHIQGMLVSTRELSSMAQLYLYHDVPIKAADILQTGMDSNRIEKTEKNYELLARAYMQAREWNKAIAPLTRAAEMSDEGKFYVLLAQSHIQGEKWGLAENALVEALNKGGLDDEADNWLLLGIARTRLEKYDAAIRAFRKAGDDDDVAKDAFRWIRSIERRLAENRRASADQ